MYLLTLLFWIGGVWCAMPHRATATFFFLLLIHFLHTASSGKMTRPQEEVWTAEAEALGLIQCCVWLAATPGDGEMCHGSLAGMKRLVEVEVEMEVTSPPPLPLPPSIPLSFTDLYLASPFFSSRPLF